MSGHLDSSDSADCPVCASTESERGHTPEDYRKNFHAVYNRLKESGMVGGYCIDHRPSTEPENKGFFSFLKPRVEFCRVQISPDTDRCDVPGLSLSRYGDATVQVGQDGYVDVCWLKPVYNLGHFILFLLACGVWGISLVLIVLVFWTGAGIVFEDLFMSWGWI